MTTQPTSDARWIQENEHELFADKPDSFFDHKDCRVCGPGPLKRNQVPSAFKHVFYRLDTEVREDEYSSWTVEVRKACGPSDAIVVSSELEGEPKMHSVMLDINLPCRLIESSTPGHFHLYIDHKLPWRRYRRLLRALSRAGIIEPGYYGISVKRRATHLRPPWKEKS